VRLGIVKVVASQNRQVKVKSQSQSGQVRLFRWWQHLQVNHAIEASSIIRNETALVN
jgi:hypothetical protein